MPETSVVVPLKVTPLKIEKIYRASYHSFQLREYPAHAKNLGRKEPEYPEDPTQSHDEYSEGQLDLNEHLLRNPETTFFVRVSGDSMIDGGIQPGDLLVVDRSLRPANGAIVIAVVSGNLTIKKLLREAGKLYLVPENPNYPCIEINDEMDFMIWGVVTHVIHSL